MLGVTDGEKIALLFAEIRNTSCRSSMKLRQNCYFQTVTRMNADLELHFGMANADLPSELLEKDS